MKLPFALPPLAQGAPAPVWTDELTCLHENTAESNHWIDAASRQYAVWQLGKSLPQTRNRVILEIGCSAGAMLRLMHKKFSDAMIIGSDCISRHLQNLAKEFKDIPMIQFDLLQCPLPDASVDAVVLLNVLEHIQDDAAALRQIQRILKPGGVMVLEVPSGPALYDYYDKTLMHYRRYSRTSLSLIVRQAGLTIARCSHLGFLVFPAFWLVKKRNRRLANHDGRELQNAVKKNISETKSNPILRSLIKAELALGKIYCYPVGIRCVMTCLKPEQ